MAEVQKNTESGEMAQRFIEFVMMQAQNAMLFLGQIPHPQSGQPEVNLDVAKMFIDQLAMIREKTRGNLSNDEAGILGNTLTNLQMAFVEISQKQGGGQPPIRTGARESRSPKQRPPRLNRSHPPRRKRRNRRRRRRNRRKNSLKATARK